MAYIANMPDGQLPAWLSANRLMLWTLLALRDLGGRAHLDALYRRLGEVLRIPEDLLRLEHPTGARQEDYVIRHRMRFALTYLNFLGLVNSHGQGDWSLSDEGADFLKPLDEEDAPMAERDWSRETGIELTPVEMLLSNKLMADQQADHRTRFPRNPPTPPERPDDWPEEPFRSHGAPPRTAEHEENLRGVEALTALFEEEIAAHYEKLAATTSRIEEISRLLAPLDAKERQILKLRFGLDSGEQWTLEEIGKHLGYDVDDEVVAQAMSKLVHALEDSPRTLIAAFEGTCVRCTWPISIGDAIAIQYQPAKSKYQGIWPTAWPVSSHDAPPAVEGWRHDRCPRSGPGGTRVPARVPPPGNPPKESAVRQRLFPAEDDD